MSDNPAGDNPAGDNLAHSARALSDNAYHSSHATPDRVMIGFHGIVLHHSSPPDIIVRYITARYIIIRTGSVEASVSTFTELYGGWIARLVFGLEGELNCA